ncbi:MAG: preprotein translocase subunit YajC [Alphaproteobacteria bacterium]|jgi:preprotein translocase subunit YajC|nr:preprotein translocase subunit YajC [Alphaproteobacteria bacterium]|tara:strand:- start:14 stop:427 length:414 start_codon:yes stop_codon:yes gene_type:complete
MFISDAFAQTAGAAEPSIFQMFLPLILIGAVFYFLLIRPQQKKMKEHNAMLDAIRRGDRIVTGGGIVGTVARVNDNELLVDISQDVRVTVMRGTVADVLSKTEPVASDKPETTERKSPDEKAGENRLRKRGRSRKNG